MFEVQVGYRTNYFWKLCLQKGYLGVRNKCTPSFCCKLLGDQSERFRDSRLMLRPFSRGLREYPKFDEQNYREPLKGFGQVWWTWGEKLRSPACSRQENAIFPPHIQVTWRPPFRPSLYVNPDGFQDGSLQYWRPCCSDVLRYQLRVFFWEPVPVSAPSVVWWKALNPAPTVGKSDSRAIRRRVELDICDT